MADPAPVAKLTFEQALAELETIVAALESGKAELDASIASYERGIALRQHCERKLAEAREKIEKISIGPGGAIASEPFDPKG